MPTVNGDFQNQGSVVQTDRFGLKVTLPTITANQVLTIDEDTAAAPEDGAVVAVDTDAAGGDVVLTIEEILPGSRVEVINLGTGGQVDLAGGTGVTLQAGSASGTSIPATEYATAELTHYKGGNVTLTGDLEADA